MTTEVESNAARLPLVMVIDDDRSARKLLKMYLEHTFEVVEANNGAEALSILRRVRPDVIVSDVEMPQVNGLALARILKAERTFAQIPLLLVTGHAGKDAVVECLDAGADDYLSKPVARKEFLARVGAAARQTRLRRELGEALAELQRVKNQLQLTLDCAADAIISYDACGRIRTHNAAAEQLFGTSELNSHSVGDLLPQTQAWWNLGATASVTLERAEHSQYLELTVGAEHNSGSHVAVIRDVTWRVDAQRKLQQAQDQLVRSSRLAGQAEVATGVLHNVGNVLNSINVSATLVAEAVSSKHERKLQKLTELLEGSQSVLRDALGEKGPLILSYCRALTQDYSAERAHVVEELTRLNSHVSHAKTVVRGQQRLARSGGMIKDVSVPELVSTAQALVGGRRFAHAQFNTDIQCETVVADEHRVLEILVNLLKNASEAVVDAQAPQISVTATGAGDCSPPSQVVLRVSDNGVGLDEEARRRIFEHGFTTKHDGHGFGLHYCAIAAKEMGASLEVESEGPGKGCTFSLTLPGDCASQPLESRAS